MKTLKMKTLKKILLVFIIIIIVRCIIYIIGAFLYNFYEPFYNKVNIDEAESIINRIEDYKKANGHLPKTLGEIGFEEYCPGNSQAYEYMYEIINDSVYTISFLSISKSMNVNYFSDTKQWKGPGGQILQ